VPLDLRLTVLQVRRGRADPCMRVWEGECWRATRTPAGPATLHLRHHGARLEAEAWGAGAGWALEHVPALVGLDVDHDLRHAPHPLVAGLARRLAAMRTGRTLAVAEALAPTVVEQRVTAAGARRSWASLVRRLGEPAPGPAGGSGLLLPPEPATLAATPSWVWHRADVERRRADTVRRAMARSVRLEECTAMSSADARQRLTAFPGVGVWTAAEVARVALGDPDAVSVGDYHLKHAVSWALAGEPRGTDERMLDLLEPFRPLRGRAVRLIEVGFGHAPRFGPRTPVGAIAAI
jgi:3-methyladenine DNA glycosylase/8-oxoguanine DNA glycosylase